MLTNHHNSEKPLNPNQNLIDF